MQRISRGMIDEKIAQAGIDAVMVVVGAVAVIDGLKGATEARVGCGELVICTPPMSAIDVATDPSGVEADSPFLHPPPPGGRRTRVGFVVVELGIASLIQPCDIDVFIA